MKAIAPRRPWPANFPEVVIHTSLPSRDAHPAYGAAKSGDASAAIRLALDLASEAAIDALRLLVAYRDALMLPVIADEAAGYNAIPDGFAHVLGDALTLPVVSGAIVQINKVGHTRAPALQRLVTPALFAGEVIASANYVLIDDHVGLGGTLANLRGHIESRGAVVIAMTTLTESRDARRISPRPETLLLLGELMDINSKSFGEPSLGTDLTASPRSKPRSYVVNHPLSPSRISWLRQQSKHVAEVWSRWPENERMKR